MIYLTYKNFTWTTSVFFSYFVWRSICSYNHYIPDFSVNLQPRAKYLGKNKKQHSKNTFVDFIFVIFRFLCFFVCVCVCVFCFVCVFLLVYSEAAVEDFFKIDVNKNFTIFTGKHLCLICSFDKVGDYRITTIFFLWILRNFQERLFLQYTSGGCFCVFIDDIFPVKTGIYTSSNFIVHILIFTGSLFPD